MAQVVAARLDMMLRNQRVLTVKIDGGGLDGGISMVEFAADCSAITRRSFVEVFSSRYDIASRTNAVTIAVNKAALKEVRTKNTAASGKANVQKSGDYSYSSSTFSSSAGPIFPQLSHTCTIWTEAGRRLRLMKDKSV